MAFSDVYFINHLLDVGGLFDGPFDLRILLLSKQFPNSIYFTLELCLHLTLYQLQLLNVLTIVDSHSDSENLLHEVQILKLV
jgi:hypothetical protein